MGGGEGAGVFDRDVGEGGMQKRRRPCMCVLNRKGRKEIGLQYRRRAGVDETHAGTLRVVNRRVNQRPVYRITQAGTGRF